MQTMASYKKENPYFVFGLCNSNVARGKVFTLGCIYVFFCLIAQVMVNWFIGKMVVPLGWYP